MIKNARSIRLFEVNSISRHERFANHSSEKYEVSMIKLDAEMSACMITIPCVPIPDFFQFQHTFHVRSSKNKNEAIILIDETVKIVEFILHLIKMGATLEDGLFRKLGFTTEKKKPSVKVNGWTVHIIFDLSCLHHLLFMPDLKYKPIGSFRDYESPALFWDGEIKTTRKHWAAEKRRLVESGLTYDGDNPEDDITIPTSFNAESIPGWNTPAPNGYLLHSYQKEGALFCAKRGMRALIGDEMGIGKTAQAIAAAVGTSAKRVVIICPSSARYVWQREIIGWGGGDLDSIQHLKNKYDKLDLTKKWHIVTYELIVTRAEKWRINNDQELLALKNAVPELFNSLKNDDVNFPMTISIEKPLANSPMFSSSNLSMAWEKMMQRLAGELLIQILEAGPLLTIVDEAHRVKNKLAKRTQAIKKIAFESENQLLMLTGTPLRNNENEAAVLLSLLDGQPDLMLGKKFGYHLQDVKDYLQFYMIRRTKNEVLPELPLKIRQRIDITNLDQSHMELYKMALTAAFDAYESSRRKGASELEARKIMLGKIEKARVFIGLAKIYGSDVSDIVCDVVDSKGCAVVFSAHHQVTDALKCQLIKEGLNVDVFDGRTPEKRRTEIVDNFQDGKLDVIICGINSAGESINLSRADTVIFIELDWVPAALLQAEDRIHRVGQINNCLIMHLIANTEYFINLDEMMIDSIGTKMARIGEVMDEDGSNVIASGSIQKVVSSRFLSIKSQNGNY